MQFTPIPRMRMATVKISSKLVVLIGLSIAMIGVQFAIGGYFNNKMSDSMKSSSKLDRVSDSFYNAIIEEKGFIQSHRDESFDLVIRYLKEADEEMSSFTTASGLNMEDLSTLKSVLANYRESFTRLVRVIREIDAIEREFKKTVELFNERADIISQKLTGEIATRLVNAQEVPEQFRAFQEITLQTTMLINWTFLTLSQDLMLKNDIKSFLDRNNRYAEELQTSKKNAAAISRFVTGQEYTDFVQQVVIRNIDLIPGQTARLYALWKDKIVRQKELDEIRMQAMVLEAKILASAGEEIDQLGDRLFWAGLGAICLTVCAVFLVGMGIMRSISRPISGLTKIAGDMAEGNLRNAVQQLASFGTGRIDNGGGKAGDDEVGRLSIAFGRMVQSLHSLIAHVRNSGIQVVSSATEISASARELEASAAQQAASVTQVSVASRQISTGSHELAKTMSGVVAVASQTAALAQEGQTGLQGMEATMRRLMEATGFIASKLETISEKTNNIGSVVTTINRVADQTNLLSLNAAIEAEKAGEYGLGFSVVAREIRRLADQSAIATLDIEKMVKEMQSAVSSGVMEVDKFVQQVRHGGDSITEISSQLALIIDQVRELIPRFDEVNGAMETQSTSAEEISGAMVQLSEGAEQTRQVVSEFNRVVEQLTDAVNILQQEVSKFQLDSGER